MPFAIDHYRKTCLQMLEQPLEPGDQKLDEKELKQLKNLINRLCDAFKNKTLNTELATLKSKKIISDVPANNSTDKDKLLSTIQNYIIYHTNIDGKNTPLQTLEAFIQADLEGRPLSAWGLGLFKLATEYSPEDAPSSPPASENNSDEALADHSNNTSAASPGSPRPRSPH